jgi:rod shape-determining protein MreD
MVNKIISNLFRFVGLTLLQVLILDNIEISGYINPYIYILFIALLPLETPDWLVLVLGFGLGMTIDLFSGTPGMHTSATLLGAFSRKFLLKYLEPRDGYSSVETPDLKNMGIRWFLVYTGLLFLIHHLCLFYVEMFRFSEFFRTFFRAISSLFFTLLFTFLGQLLINAWKRK